MKVPAFRYMGGKAKLRNWLLQYFPKSGWRYIEPFCGRGNVFFAAVGQLDFKEWNLSDIDISFFSSLFDLNIEDLPDSVNTKEEFLYYKNIDNDVSKVLEPRITFAGKGYSAGFNNCKDHYKGKNYRETCKKAKELLIGVGLTEASFEGWNYKDMNEDTFCYFDPPYYETKASYPNIDHNVLINILNNAKFKWALSGYNNDLYKKELKYKNIYKKVRSADIKQTNSGKKEVVEETLWTNY